MFKNVATSVVLFAFDTTTGAAKTGDEANITPYVSKDYGAVTVLGTTTATELDATNAKGWYKFTVAQAETNADVLLFTAKSSTANVAIVGQYIFTTPNRFSSLVIDSAGLADANMVKAGPSGSGTAQTARDLGASVLVSSGTGTGQLDVTSGVIKANLAQILGTALTETAGQIAAGFKKFFNIATPASTMDSLTLVATATNLTNAPTSGDFTATMKTSIGTAVAASAVASVTGNVGGNVTGSVGSVATSGITSSSFAAGAINAAAIATDAIDADALAADAVAEIQSGLSTLDAAGVRAAVGLASANLDTQLDALPTAAEVTDAVWDEDLSGHTTTGSAGAGLAAAGSAGDPWSTPLPGAYGAGTAGKIVGDNLDATVSSRLADADYTAPLDAAGTRSAVGLASANLDTQLSGIQSDTNDLQTQIGTAGAGLTALGDTRLDHLDADVSSRLPTSSYTAPDNADILLIKAKTDPLTFTKANELDVNVQSVNGVTVAGTGTNGDEWGPA